MGKNIIIIIIVVVLVVAGVIFFLLNKDKLDQETAKNDQMEEVTEPELGEVSGISTDLKSQLSFQARTIIERYGTYSSDSDYQNLTELLDLMSEKLAAETAVIIEQGPEEREGFYSIVTKVGSIELIRFDLDSMAIFTASVQEQSMFPGETSVLNKTANLVFIKQGEKWKVDSISFGQ
ncbi:hypothetical protein IID20_01095 [Patescibacteria group bacterium]|nr:hypothetical protein [Patescibacteria group bacterium]